MLAYDDVDHDTHLNLNEFYAAFSKLYTKFYFALYHQWNQKADLISRFPFFFLFPALGTLCGSTFSRCQFIYKYDDSGYLLVFFFSLSLSLVFFIRVVSYESSFSLCQPSKEKVLGPFIRT